MTQQHQNLNTATQPQNIIDLLAANKAQIKAALPKHMTPDRMSRIALTEARRNPKLFECSPVSLLGAIIQASQLGLEPGIHSHLVPFYNKHTGHREVQMIPDYRGLMDIARRSGDVATISAHEVYANDLFEFEYGTDEHIRHIPTRKQRGELIGAYAIARFKDSNILPQFQFMSTDEIEAIRARSKAGDSGPWTTDYAAMCKKTVIRQLCKFLPVSIELQQAVNMDELADAGQSQGNAALIDAEFENLSYQPPGKPEVKMPQAVTPAKKTNGKKNG